MKNDLHTPGIHDMTENTVDVISTSSVTADVSPIVLSQTDILRFKFLPTLVKNQKAPQKSVLGKLLYEKNIKLTNCFQVMVGAWVKRYRVAQLKLAIGWSFS